MREEISCTKCHVPILAGYYNTPALVLCPSCHTPVRIDVFPALFRRLRPGDTGEASTDTQASCYYHPSKKALIPCDHCGRFLCALCDVEWGDKHLCPACLDTGKKKGRILNLERHRTLYDGLAVRIALFPMIIPWLTAVTAPVALYFAIRHWNSPMSIIPRTRIRFVLAIVLSGLQILAWAGWISYLASRR